MWRHIEKVAHPSSDREDHVETLMDKTVVPKILVNKKTSAILHREQLCERTDMPICFSTVTIYHPYTSITFIL